MKRCPYCAEDIHDDAIKCKHCNEFLQAPASSPPAVHTLKNFLNFDDPATKRTAIISLIGFLLVILCAVGYQHHRTIIAQQVAKRASEITALKSSFEPFDKLDASSSVGLHQPEYLEIMRECRLALDKLQRSSFQEVDIQEARLKLTSDLEDIFVLMEDTKQFWQMGTDLDKVKLEEALAEAEAYYKLEKEWPPHRYEHDYIEHVKEQLGYVAAHGEGSEEWTKLHSWESKWNVSLDGHSGVSNLLTLIRDKIHKARLSIDRPSPQPAVVNTPSIPLPSIEVRVKTKAEVVPTMSF